MKTAKLIFVLLQLITFMMATQPGSTLMGQELWHAPEPKQSVYPHIDWVKSWPSTKRKNVSKRIKDQLNFLFLGNRRPDLMNPVAVFANDPEDMWILDQGNKTVFQVIKEVGHIPQPIYKTDLDLSSLVGICSGPNTSILFTDSHACKVYRLDQDNRKLQVLNDTMKLAQPTGIAYFAAKKEIWVVETKAHCVTVLNEKGDLVKRIGKRGTAPGEFNFPTHLWIDRKGNVYINDAMNFRIQVLSPEGQVISVFGEAGDATGYFARPKGIATDSFGNIYVVDALFHVVQVFDMNGSFLYKFGSQGHGDGEFWMPTGLYIDDKNYIYVADSYNSRVQIFHLNQTGSK